MFDDIDFERYRRQELLLAVLGLAAVAVLMLAHVVFVDLLGPPSTRLFVTLLVFAVLETGVLAWLRAPKRTLPPRLIALAATVSVVVPIVFARLADAAQQTEENPYPILMIPAIIAAAFRFRLRWLVVVLAAASALVMYDPWIEGHGLAGGDHGEMFESALTATTLWFMGLLVWFLARLLYRESRLLRLSVAELRRTQDRLVAEEKLAAVGRLSSSIAHEIRNPVGMISSSLVAAQDAALDASSREQMFTIAGKEAARLERLTSDFLAYARPARPERTTGPVEPVLRYVAEIARARAAERQVELRVDCAGGAVAALDPFQLQQALLNLVLNGIEAAGTGTCVVIGGSGPNPVGTVELFVENDGAPVPDAARERLFEPFFTTKPRGTGLGLAISRNIARAHGGDLELTRNDGGRVRFSIWIPGA